MGRSKADLEAALTAQALLMLDVARQLVLEVLAQPRDATQARGRLHLLLEIASLRASLNEIEALTAGILNRSGVSWDVMAGMLDVSRQALNRRLTQRADQAFEQLGRPRRWKPADVSDLATSIVSHAERVADDFEHDVQVAAQYLSNGRRERWWEHRQATERWLYRLEPDE